MDTEPFISSPQSIITEKQRDENSGGDSDAKFPINRSLF